VRSTWRDRCNARCIEAAVTGYRARDLLSWPSLVSASRLGLAVAFPFAMRRRRLAFGVLAAAALTDVLDGWLARRLNQVSRAGAVMDGVADKTFAATVLSTLVAGGLLRPAAALLLVTREVLELPLVLGLGLSAEARRRPVSREANAAGKLTTFAQFAAVAAVLLRARGRGVLVGATAGLGAAAAASYALREISHHASEYAP
jgi:Phosphatidylglycerophosphate synthase